jgi:hypothetical protein
MLQKSAVRVSWMKKTPAGSQKDVPKATVLLGDWQGQAASARAQLS